MKYQFVKNQRPIKYKEFIQQIQNSSRSSLNDHSILSQRSFRESSCGVNGGNGNNRGCKIMGENKNIFIDDSSSPEQRKDYNGQQVKEMECKIMNKLEQQQHHSSNKLLKQSPQQNNNDKLYTFCDAKLTQRSVEIKDKENHPLNNQYNHRNHLQQITTNHANNNNQQLDAECFHNHKPFSSEQKYFRTNKQKTQQKENINFVNNILAKMDSIHEKKHKVNSSFGKCQKEEGSFLKVKQNYDPILSYLVCEPSQPNSLMGSQQNTQRKVQNVRKVTLKPSVVSNSQKNNHIGNNQSNQKSRQSSLTSIKKKQSHPSQQTGHKQVQQSKEKQKNASSKKKIVSLNINSIKSNNIQNHNKIKLKLSMDRSSEKDRLLQQSGSQKKPKLRQSQNVSIIEGKKLLYGSLVSENTKMGSLEQSKIQAINHDLSNPHLLMSGSSLTDLTNLLTKQPTAVNVDLNQQIQRLYSVISNQNEHQKQLSKQIYELNQRLKNFRNQDDKKELQILQKDCYRLTTSYKEIKRLYQIQVESKQEIEAKYQGLLIENSNISEQLKELKVANGLLRQQNSNFNQATEQLRSQNSDLKECLKYKESVMKELQCKITKMDKHVRQLEQQLSRQHFPPQLQGLSDMIKEKISQYEESIGNYVREIDEFRTDNMQLQEENEKLMVIRGKLENFTALLKGEIDQKDVLIEDYESQLKQFSQLRKSIKTDNHNNEFIENKLRSRIRELESKLKLANSHIEYLTKEIIDIKHDREGKYVYGQRQGQGKSVNNNKVMQNKYQTVKSTNLTTIGNTITTRNSSITHFDIMNCGYPYMEHGYVHNNNRRDGSSNVCHEQQYGEIKTLQQN